MEQWIKTISKVAEPYFLEISVGLLILLWLLFFIRYHISLVLPIIKEYNSFSLFLSQLTNLEESNEARISGYLNLNKKSQLNSVWNDYLENRKSQADYEYYFNETNLINVPAKKEQVVTVPAFLLTIGLVLAFLCLFISFASVPDGITLSSNLYSVISKVVLIVIFAILISYLYDILNRSFYAKAKASVYKIQRLLCNKLGQTLEEDQFAHMTASIDNLTSSLSNYAQYTTDMQRNSINHLTDSFLESLYGETNGQIQSLRDSLCSFTSSQAQSVEQTQALVNKLVTGVKNQENINLATESIVSSITQYQKEIADSSHLLTVSLKELHQVSEAFNDMSQLNSQTLETMKTERDSLKEEYSRYIQTFSNTIQEYQKNYVAEWENAMVRFSDISNKSFTQMENSITQSMNTWISSNQTLKKSLEEQSQSMNHVSDEIAVQLKELNGSLKETMKEFTTAVGEGTEKTINEFDQGLTEITQRLSQTITEIRDSIDDLPVVIDSLKSRLK